MGSGEHLWAWGRNDKGQLASEEAASSSSRSPIYANLLPRARQVRQLSCGYGHVLLVTSNGEALGCGENSHGQLGLGHCNVVLAPTKISKLSDIFQVATGDRHTLALTISGTLFSFGCNDCGQL
eukprot:CAMPEP_0114153368 /NCGR_PEP_ID=MMETSP0043_2-20121206/24313_1 /TAXON_ID=464988 /ORGANISM="Hemiselmis andersenii, Strain CCMP644" /LENGTH=123 /DNA_ID=CAMNT_0001248389 /DNA_START=88 /DNA_END=455 /DNA_ORIENTATION=-